MTDTDTTGRRRFSLGAALDRLRERDLPVAKSPAEVGGDPLSAPLDVAAIIDPNRQPVTLCLADQRGSLPPIPKPDAAELAVLVERHASAVWSSWVAGTSEPGWNELPEKIRERVRLASRAGLTAVGLTPEGGTEP